MKPKAVFRIFWHATAEMDAAAIDLAAGVRASLALSVPALLGIATNLHLGTWASLGGFETSLADPGGSYSKRAITTLSTALAGSLVMLGTVAAGHPILIPPKFTLSYATAIQHLRLDAFVWSTR